MPTLSIKYGSSSVSYLYLKKDGSYTWRSFDYTFLSNLYAHFTSEQKFYTDIFNYILKSAKVVKKDLKVVATGYPTVPSIDYPYELAKDLEALAGSDSRYEVINSDQYSFYTQNLDKIHQSSHFSSLVGEDKDYLANMYFYNGSLPATLDNLALFFSHLEESHKKAVYDVSQIKENRPKLISGDILQAGNKEIKNALYIYLISIIKPLGFHSVFIDERDSYYHFLLLKTFSSEFETLYNEYQPEAMGTLLNSPGETSCLFESEVGTKQLVELASNKLFIVPSGVSTNYRVLVKNTVLGDVERQVKGGSIGIMIDTRDKGDQQTYSPKSLSLFVRNSLSSFTEASNKI